MMNAHLRVVDEAIASRQRAREQLVVVPRKPLPFRQDSQVLPVQAQGEQSFTQTGMVDPGEVVFRIRGHELGWAVVDSRHELASLPTIPGRCRAGLPTGIDRTVDPFAAVPR